MALRGQRVEMLFMGTSRLRKGPGNYALKSIYVNEDKVLFRPKE
jgi:hypothetical protein